MTNVAVPLNRPPLSRADDRENVSDERKRGGRPGGANIFLVTYKNASRICLFPRDKY